MRTTRFGGVGGMAAILALACIAYLGASRVADVDLADRLGEFAPSTASTYRAFVVFQAADCDSRLGFLNLFERPKLARVSVLGLFAGTEKEAEQARAYLARTRLDVEVHRIDRKTARALRAIGYRQTPFLIAVDTKHRVRLAAALPSTESDYVQLAALLETLVDR